MFGVKATTKMMLVRILTSFDCYEPGGAYEVPAGEAKKWAAANMVREITDDFERRLAELEVQLRNEIH